MVGRLAVHCPTSPSPLLFLLLFCCHSSALCDEFRLESPLPPLLSPELARSGATLSGRVARRLSRPPGLRLQVHLECGDLLLHLHLAVSIAISARSNPPFRFYSGTVFSSKLQIVTVSFLVLSHFNPPSPLVLFLDGSPPLALKRNVAAMVSAGRAVFLNIVKTTISDVRRRASTVSLNVDYPALFSSNHLPASTSIVSS